MQVLAGGTYYLKYGRGTVFLQFLVCGLEATYQMFHHPLRMDQLLVCTLEEWDKMRSVTEQVLRGFGPKYVTTDKRKAHN